MPDFEELMKLTEDSTKEQIREQGTTKIQEFQSQQDKRDQERAKRFVGGRLSRRWSRHLNLDESFRAPFNFTWRC
jgi:hypothetical protein